MKRSWGNWRLGRVSGALGMVLLATEFFYPVPTAAAVIKDAVLGYVVAAVPSSVVNPTPSVVISKEFFGLHIHRAADLKAWPTARAGSWRLWDAYTSWRDLEPKKGQWNFAQLDFDVNYAAQRGVEILLPLGNTPVWASARPTEPCAYGVGCAAEPLNIQDWRNYVKTVATRYKGRIKQFEIWNEVNLTEFYSGSPDKLLELQRAAYEEIKAVDPSNILVAPSFTGNNTNEITKLDRYLAKGAGAYSDAISYHLYTPGSSPEAVIPLVTEIRKVMRKHSIDRKPLWNTESGWALLNNDGTPLPATINPQWRKLNNELGAAYLARAYVLSAALGVERNYWYAWDNKILGLIDPKTRAVKGAAVALTNVATWLNGGRMQGCEIAQVNFWACSFTHASGATKHIVWAVNDIQGDFFIPNNWDAKDMLGLDNVSVSIPKSRVIKLGAMPVMLY